ncbi:MAG: ATP-binding protein [Muribaculaceae bacterium]|nr:ATP-binding protein [Muribaculaceae bacterium]
MCDRDVITQENVGYPIGEQDFKVLRKMDCLYVDKTMYIDKLIASRSKYYFLARPRRFGKSLFLSTLRYFFEGQRELFSGLYIDSIQWDWEQYPVLYLDLNTERYAEQSELDAVLDNLFRFWEEKYDVTVSSDNLSQRFKNIIKGAHEKTGREVVILVDEYDKPLVSNLNRDDNFEYYRSKLASIYSNFKSSAEHIKFVFITGVSRFSKLSVFSDLNNIRDISFSDEFADICGITEKELLSDFSVGIEKLAEKKRLTYEGACNLLKRNYDGYHFTPTGSDLYNPWSVLNALVESNIGSYWVHTGVPTIIAEALRDVDADLENILNTRCSLDSLAGLDLKNADPLALLYQTGYLTIKRYQRKFDTVTLGVPNREVRKGLFDVLLPYYVNVKRGTPASVVRDIINNIELGEPEKLMKNLDIFLAGIPYEMKMEDENNFHNAIYILLTLIGVNAETEVHTSDGRIDLMIKSDDYIYIIELKFDKDSGSALNQIEEKGYAHPYLNDSRQIFCIGANFSSETRHLDNINLKSFPKEI